MSDRELDSALSYALQRLGTPDVKLKKEQVASIECVYRGKDVFVWLPTGFGKSIIYHTLPFVFDSKLGRAVTCSDVCSVVLVISPLVLLMTDQVLDLRRRGVRSAVLTAGGGVDKTIIATDEDVEKCSLLFCAPEALIGSRCRETLERGVISNRIVAVAIDEAHCVSKW